MAKALAVVGTIAGVASKFLPPPFNLIAAGVSIAASIGAALLQKPPPVLGSPTSMQIGANLPALYPVGRTFVAGSKVHDRGYGPTTGGVPNPYRSLVIVGLAAGPAAELEKFQVDFTDVTFTGDNAIGYYHDYLYRSTQLGACPEAAALAGPFGAIPNWGSAYKLSGKTAWLLTLKDNREGKTWSGGVPNFGHVGKWALAYDARQDDTYPGGEGDCRALDEETYVFGEAGENPGCVGATYALGRWQNGKRVMGFGFPVSSIDWPAWVEFANVCEANGWKCGGLLAEGFGISRWDNLKRICQAGGARPAFVGGKLTVIFPRPRVAVDTIHLRDLTGRARFMAMRSFAERKNTLIGRVRLESNRWDETQMDPVDVADFVTADGEVKKEERQFQLVQDSDQGAELLRYEIWERREMGPLVIPVGPRFLSYKPGVAFALGDDLVADLDPEGVLELEGKLATLEGRQIDPESATVELTLLIETPGKHAAVLGTTGTAAVAPAPPTGEELDGVAGQRGVFRIVSRNVDFPVTSDDDQIDVAAFTGVLDDGRTLNFPSGSVGGLASGTIYAVLWSQSGAAYSAVASPAAAAMADRDYVFLGWQSTLTGGVPPSPPPPPPGWGGGGNYHEP